MEESTELFRDLCENASDLIQCVSEEGKLLYVNRAWVATLGYGLEELPSLTVMDIVHPDSREHCQAIFEKLIQGQDVERIEADFMAKQGQRICVEGSVRCQRDAGKAAVTQGIFRNVTERVQTQEELDRLFDVSLDLLCVAGTNGYFQQVNPAFERVLGYHREELLSRSFIEFVHPDDRERTLDQVEILAGGGTVVDFQNRYQTKSGDWRWLAWRATPLPERGLIYAVARDMTDHVRNQETQKRQADELSRSNAELEQFAYVASHDLRAPLRSISHLAEWVEEGLPVETGEKVRHDLARLRRRSKRLMTLVDDLLRYSRAGRVPGRIRQVDTAAMVREFSELLGPPEGFTVSIESPLPVFDTDVAALEQVLRNLIGNAIKHHGPPPGNVRVSWEDHGEFHLFEVGDDGPGIPEKHRERVFQMFQKLESQDVVEGTGLGLALVKRLIEMQGGEIKMGSADGGGLTVRFTWPKRIAAEEGGYHADDPDR